MKRCKRPNSFFFFFFNWLEVEFELEAANCILYFNCISGEEVVSLVKAELDTVMTLHD